MSLSSSFNPTDFQVELRNNYIDALRSPIVQELIHKYESKIVSLVGCGSSGGGNSDVLNQVLSVVTKISNSNGVIVDQVNSLSNDLVTSRNELALLTKRLDELEASKKQQPLTIDISKINDTIVETPRPVAPKRSQAPSPAVVVPTKVKRPAPVEAPVTPPSQKPTPRKPVAPKKVATPPPTVVKKVAKPVVAEPTVVKKVAKPVHVHEPEPEEVEYEEDEEAEDEADEEEDDEEISGGEVLVKGVVYWCEYDLTADEDAYDETNGVLYTYTNGTRGKNVGKLVDGKGRFTKIAV